MAFDKKKQIRGIRILLTVFYGFLLSSILFRYIIHGIVETIRRPTNPFSIGMIAVGGLVLISILLATYATWFDNAVILLVSGIVFIFVFILTLIFGIIRIVKTAPTRVQTTDKSTDVLTKTEGSNVGTFDAVANQYEYQTDMYALIEDITKLTIELLFILLAIFATFALHRYIKAKYTPVRTRERT